MSTAPKFIVICGANGSGKSSYILKLCHGLFVEDYDPSILEEYSFRYSLPGQENIIHELSIREYAETEYKSCANIEYRAQMFAKADGIIFIFSITSRETFDNTAEYFSIVCRSKNLDTFPCILVGNKCDMESLRQVEKTDAQELAEAFGCPYFEISVKQDFNIKKMIDEIMNEIINTVTDPPTIQDPIKKKCILM